MALKSARGEDSAGTTPLCGNPGRVRRAGVVPRWADQPLSSLESALGRRVRRSRVRRLIELLVEIVRDGEGDVVFGFEVYDLTVHALDELLSILGVEVFTVEPQDEVVLVVLGVLDTASVTSR